MKNVIQRFITQNPCYRIGERLNPKGLMLHSVGCPQPSADVFIRTFDNRNYGRAAVHGFIDATTGVVYQTLPWTMKGWHGGGSSNATHIGIEMCEPSSIKYYPRSAKISMKDIDDATSSVRRTYNSAVELFADLCIMFNLDPMKKGVIISHNEGHKLGVASGHVDPEHLWKGVGSNYTMDTFREDVRKTIESKKGIVSEEKKEEPKEEKIIYRVQVGAFKIKDYALNYLDKVRASGFEGYIVKYNEIYRIQIGAFAKRKNAEDFEKRAQDAGYDAFVTISGQGEIVGGINNIPNQPKNEKFLIDKETHETIKKMNIIKEGSIVTLVRGSKTYDGQRLADFNFNRKYKVSSLSGNRAIITINDIIVAAMNVRDLNLVK